MNTSRVSQKKDKKLIASKTTIELSQNKGTRIQGNKVASLKNLKTFKEDLIHKQLSDNSDLEKPTSKFERSQQE